MPIFKYGSSEVIEAIVHGLFESLPLLVIDGFAGGLGDIEIPFIQVDGFSSDVFGDILLPKTGIIGGVGAECNAALKLPEIAGNAVEVPSGNLTLPQLDFSGHFGASCGFDAFEIALLGEIGVGAIANGDLLLHCFDIVGTTATDSSVIIRKLLVSGFAFSGNFADVIVSIPSIEVDGFCTIIIRADAEVRVTCIEVDGNVLVGAAINADVRTPSLSIDGDILVGSAIDGNISLRKLSIQSIGAQGGTLSLRRLNVSGVVIGGNEIFGDITFRYDLSGTVLVGSALDGSVPIPGAEVDGDVLVGSAIDGEVSFTLNAVSGDVSVTPTISGEIDLVWPAITGQALVPAGASGDVSLRLVAVDGRVDITAFADCSFSRPEISISGSLSIPIIYSSEGVVKLGIISVSGTAFYSSVQSSSEDEVLHYDISRRLI